MTIQETTINPSSTPNNNTNNSKHPQGANKPLSMWLYDAQTQSLLQQAHEQAVQKQQREDAEANRIYPVVRTYDDEDYDQSSSEEEDGEEGERSSSSSSSSSEEEEEGEGEVTNKQNANGKQPKQKATKKKELTPKQTKRLQQEIHQHRVNLIKTAIPLCIQEKEEEEEPKAVTDNESQPNDDDHLPSSYTHNLQLPTALLSKSEQQYGTPVSKAKAFLDLSTQLSTTTSNSSSESYVVVLLLQSGKFAGGVFSGQGGTCLQHKTMQKYTVRKGQGKAQSAQDGKRRPKSMGSQLRRQGELQLKEDVQTLLWKEWKAFIERACLILISCPKTMLSTLLVPPKGPQWSGINKAPPVLSRKDSRIRKIPMTVGRPIFESVYMVHQVLLHVSLEPITMASSCERETVVKVEEVEEEEEAIDDKDTSKPKEEEEEDETIPLLHLHHLCQAGNHAQLLDWLQTSDSVESFINRQAGTDFMTPLHYAASATRNKSYYYSLIFFYFYPPNRANAADAISSRL